MVVAEVNRGVLPVVAVAAAAAGIIVVRAVQGVGVTIAVLVAGKAVASIMAQPAVTRIMAAVGISNVIPGLRAGPVHRVAAPPRQVAARFKAE